MNPNKENFSVVTTETSDGKQMVGMFDMNASTPDENLPVSVWVKIHLKQQDQNGLSTDSEAEELNNIEDQLESLTSGRFVGRITFDGMREIYLYTKNAELAQSALDDFRKTGSYEFESEIKDDPQWVIVGSYLKKIS
jgi:hypothetical protein